ncbi:MAG: hypothetical protein KI786_02210, partial [Mameliella sp.]|nr:hypothetical protein [Phaeodactylibacter sp.]
FTGSNLGCSPSSGNYKHGKYLSNAEHLVLETIEISTLNDTFANCARRISFIKIDVEGHKKMTLKGVEKI